MKRVAGIALPDQERHFVGTLTRLMEEGVGFEYPALRRAMELLPADRRRVAVDVGAHIGLWSRWLVKYFQSVRAFEPIDEHAELFLENVPQLDKVRCIASRSASGTTRWGSSNTRRTAGRPTSKAPAMSSCSRSMTSGSATWTS
jgi:hypothetical protein